MRALIAILALAAACTQVAAAPASTESIERLLEATQAQSMLDAMYGQMEQAMRQSMQQRMEQAAGGRPVTDQQRLAGEQIVTKVFRMMRDELNWSTLKPDFLRIYQDTLEQEEIDGLIAFYESPVGQSTIRKMPLILQQSMAVTQERMRVLMPRMMRMVQDQVRESQPVR